MNPTRHKATSYALKSEIASMPPFHSISKPLWSLWIRSDQLALRSLSNVNVNVISFAQKDWRKKKKISTRMSSKTTTPRRESRVASRNWATWATVPDKSISKLPRYLDQIRDQIFFSQSSLIAHRPLTMQTEKPTENPHGKMEATALISIGR